MVIRFLLFSLLVTFTQTVFAQDYSLFQSNDTCTYNNEVEYPDVTLKYSSLIVDSSKSNGGIVLKYFPNTLGRNKKCFGISPTWVGPKLWNDSNGDQYLLNHRDDTVNFKFQSNAVDSSWIFLKLGAGEYIEATRLSDELENIDFTLDSIKRLQLKLRDSSGSLISDSINNIEIKISKNHGVIQGIDFYSLFYDSTKKKLKFRTIKLVGKKGFGGIEPLTRGMVYDFNIGDIFHYEIFDVQVEGKVNTIGSYEQIIVLDKNLLSNSVIYNLKRVKYVSKKVTDGSVNFKTESFKRDTVQFIYEETQNLYAGLPGILQKNQIFTWYHDSVMGRPGMFIRTEIDYSRSDSCASSYIFETYYHNQVGLGLGDWFKLSQAGAGLLHSSKRWLVYYKKGNEVWGEPTSVSSKKSSFKKLRVFPNPTKSHISIQGIDPRKIKLIDIQGKEIFEIKFSRDSNEIDVSTLENGMYILQIQTEENIYSKRIQIQH